MQKRECREKRKREKERERPIFLRVHGKPVKPLYRACIAHEGAGRPLEEVLKVQVGK